MSTCSTQDLLRLQYTTSGMYYESTHYTTTAVCGTGRRWGGVLEAQGDR